MQPQHRKCHPPFSRAAIRRLVIGALIRRHLQIALPVRTIRLMFVMHLQMLLQLIASMEILSTAGNLTGVFSQLAMDSAVFCEVGRLGEFLSTHIAL